MQRAETGFWTKCGLKCLNKISLEIREGNCVVQHSTNLKAEHTNMGDYKAVPQAPAVFKQQIDAENEEEKQEEESSKMSPLRKTAFVFSILFSVTLCCVFLWGLPCDMATCANKESLAQSTATSWSTMRPTEEM